MTARPLESPVGTRAVPDGCCYVVLTFSNSGGYALLELEEGLVAGLVDRLAGGSGAAFAPGLLTNAEAAGLGFLALRALRAVREVALVEESLAVRFSSIAPTVADVEAILALEDEWFGIDLGVTVGAIEGGGRLLLPSRALVRMCRAHVTDSRPLTEQLQPITLQASLMIGHSEVETTDLDRLGLGDALLLSGLERRDEGFTGPARLAFDGFHLFGDLAERAFTYASFTDAALSPESAMTATVPPPLPIQVEVELARVRIPLSQLGQLQPGAVLGLDMDLTDPVVLTVGGKPFARAELVDIGGEVGARIIALLS